MVKRVQALQEFAYRTGESFVTWEHYARMMTKAPGRYSTVLGRGHRHSHCSAEWLISTFLAGVIGDPKNSATRVPAYGDLRRSGTFFVQGRIPLNNETLENLETSRRINKTLTRVFTAYSATWNMQDGTSVEGTLFDHMVRLVSAIAIGSDSAVHKLIQKDFNITISIGRLIFAEIAHFPEKAGEEGWSIVTHYRSNFPQGDLSLAMVERQAVINCEHIKMLSALYADTLQHKPVIEANPGLTSSPASSLGDQVEPVSSAENEDVALSGASCTLNPHHNSTSISVGRTSEAWREHGNP